MGRLKIEIISPQRKMKDGDRLQQLRIYLQTAVGSKGAAESKPRRHRVRHDTRQ
jgi:hypothetical protein